MRRLRAKLGPEHESLIGTVRNVGYRFVTPEKPEKKAEKNAEARAEKQAEQQAEQRAAAANKADTADNTDKVPSPVDGVGRPASVRR